jgi:hypothetical protein
MFWPIGMLLRLDYLCPKTNTTYHVANVKIKGICKRKRDRDISGYYDINVKDMLIDNAYLPSDLEVPTTISFGNKDCWKLVNPLTQTARKKFCQ